MPTPKPLKCERHEDCSAPVVAKIGLPGGNAIWTCQEGFWEWRKEEEEEDRIKT